MYRFHQIGNRYQFPMGRDVFSVILILAMAMPVSPAML